jgi:protein gp37
MRDGSRKPLQLRSDHYWQQPLMWDRKAQRQEVRRRVFNSMNDWADEAADPALLGQWWDLIRKTPHLDWLLLTKRPERIPMLLPEDWGAGYSNVWLGTSVENQDYANARLPHLAQVPARVRFLSIEPMLDAINLSATGSLASIYWVIVGGESGPKARPMEPEWVDQLKTECAQAEIPFFFKQTGTLLARQLRLKHPRGEEPSEWPARWQVQQFPRL